MTIVLPAMSAAQNAAWSALLDVAEVVSRGWCLVGGQLVFLHCAERGAFPSRPTDDIDTVLDIRSHPRMLWTFTEALAGLGFRSGGESWRGHQHRWVREDATIDILIPRFLGARAESRRGVSGGTTLATIGGQGVLDRSEAIDVDLRGRTGSIWRPDLLGSLAAKAAAYTNESDSARDRHLADFAVLATCVRPDDRIHERMSLPEYRRIANALGVIAVRPEVVLGIDGAESGIERLRLVLKRSPHAS